MKRRSSCFVLFFFRHEMRGRDWDLRESWEWACEGTARRLLFPPKWVRIFHFWMAKTKEERERWCRAIYSSHGQKTAPKNLPLRSIMYDFQRCLLRRLLHSYIATPQYSCIFSAHPTHCKVIVHFKEYELGCRLYPVLSRAHVGLKVCNPDWDLKTIYKAHKMMYFVIGYNPQLFSDSNISSVYLRFSVHLILMYYYMVEI